MKTLTISPELSLPIDAVTQTFAAIGRKGAGKTYLASMLAEQMLDIGAQSIVIDPVGNWYGLRVGADGKSKGKDIFVIGGENGDVPLVPEAGARVAKLLVEKGVSAVLDISRFRQGERKRFAADFAEEFFHLKKSQRSPVHLFVEEAQLFIPQRVGSEEARMVGAFENIIRLGRNYGIGATLITQRPQSVNKEVLSQVECLCVLQVNGTHERKALEEWVQEAGADRKLVGELPGLARGEGFVWSPAWLRIFKRVHFAQKVTFDASATPEVGRAAKAATLSKVDVDALRQDLEAVIAEAEKDDPKALRRQIAELEKRLKNQTANFASETKVETVEVKVPVLDADTAEGIRNSVEFAARSAAELASWAKDIREQVTAAATLCQQTRSQNTPKIMRSEVSNLRRVSAKSADNISAKSEKPNGIGAAHVRILSRLQELLDFTHTSSIPKEQLAAWAEYSPTGGGFANYLGSLRSAGLIDYPAPGMIAITTVGESIAEPGQLPASDAEMLERAKRVLGGSEARILEVVHGSHPKAITKEELAEATGFSVGGGGFANYLGHMRTLGFIDYPQRGQVRAADWLFL